jgi:predicted ATP-dependent endonuclease of OLD family
MRLKKARIINFRSIAEMDIDLLHGCQALIGINESGKSNILRALQLLDPTTEIKPTDLRLERSNEEQVDAGSVSFHFELDADEIEDLVKIIAKNFLAEQLDLPIMAGPDKNMTLNIFCRECASGVYRIDLPNGKRSANYWILPKTYTVLTEWFKNSSESPVTVRQTNGDAELTVPPKGYIYGEGFDVKSVAEFITLTSDMLANAIALEVKNIILDKLPTCIFWRYNDKIFFHPQ